MMVDFLVLSMLSYSLDYEEYNILICFKKQIALSIEIEKAYNLYLTCFHKVEFHVYNIKKNHNLWNHSLIH